MSLVKKKGSAFKKPKSVKRVKRPKTTTKYGYFPRVKQVCTLKNLGDCSFDLTVHHIIPQCDGGSSKRSNLMVLCQRHHMQWHHPTQYKRTKLVYLDYLKAKFNKIQSS